MQKYYWEWGQPNIYNLDTPRKDYVSKTEFQSQINREVLHNLKGMTPNDQFLVFVDPFEEENYFFIYT